MKSTWRKHVIICLFLGLLGFPLYFLDLKFTGGRGGGNWITLDFRGLIFWTYITLLAIHVVVSSIAVWSFPKVGALRIHLGSMVLSLILLIAGFIAYGKLLRYGTISSQQRTLIESKSPIIGAMGSGARYTKVLRARFLRQPPRNPNTESEIRSLLEKRLMLLAPKISKR
jgi:hypothetical protein